MIRKRILILAGVLVIAGAAFGIWMWSLRERQAAGDRLVLHGNVDIRQVELAFIDSERISAIKVQEGDRVSEGQVLATLDARRFEAVVADIEARAAAQSQVLARLEAGNRPEEIRKAQADLEAAGADLENARRSHERMERLTAQGINPPQDLDDTRAALDVARARLLAATANHDLMMVGSRKEDIEAAKATLRALEAELALARKEFADATLLAPSGGIIQDRLLEPGDMASPQRPVLTLALDDPLWVRAYVSETDLGRIRPGMKAEVETDSFPGKRYEGWVGYISPTAEFTPKTVETAEVRTRLVYQVRVFVRNPQGELRLGMPASAIIPLDGSTPSGDGGEGRSGGGR
jgi:HlyD family secretion protein